ncbi:hypothetical protein PM082_003810 [Marasmius tenuissimus]|nr:hypothetical protein PM082_003810 [Marasmius tenuissimus]
MYSPTSISPDIIEIVKPVFLSHLFNWGLFGALSVQSYIYYLAFPSDRWFTKAVVAIVYTIELVQTILVTKLGFDTFGDGWGDPAAAIDPGITWLCFPIMTSIGSCIIQFYYAWRVWMLSRSKYIPLMICVLSLFQLAGGLWAGILGSGIKNFSQTRDRTQVPITIWLIGTAVCDILIAVSMLRWLFTNRSDFASTNAILARLIRLTFETGLLTSTVAVA